MVGSTRRDTCIYRKAASVAFGFLLSLGAFAQPSPPCGDSYGSSADATAIEDAMYAGTVQDCVNAITNAKATRGNRVGCADTAFSRQAPNTAHPTHADLLNLWNNVHAPGLAGYNRDCAELGREWPAAALGGLYAQLAGASVSISAIRDIADSVEGSQYSDEHAPTPLITHPGVYGFSHELAELFNPCYRGGVVADAINTWCGTVPAYCPTYNAGPWAGIDFLVVDFSLNPRAYDGGLAYDHGWAAQMMVEAALQETDPARHLIYDASARLAADWSAAEPAVRNHNYTAKNIWVLAQLYGMTGDTMYRDAMTDKVERNLKPGVLMDLDSNGLVDGMTNQPFSGLTTVAQTPGRFWDGHNSLIWYNAMNAWAAAEAYVAYRDNGDTVEAAALRPYVIAMIDNMANEILTLGTGTGIGEGAHPIPFAFLIGLWKIADYENDAQADWEDALAALYNTGYFSAFSGDRRTANAGLYLLYLSNVPYQPLMNRIPSGPGLPGQAANPVPGDGAVGVTTTPVLSWTAGTNADSHDVYFGTNPNPGPSEFQGNQTQTTFNPGSLMNATTYFWRVDSVNTAGTTAGAVWSFTTQSTGPVQLLADAFESVSYATEGWSTDWEFTTEAAVSPTHAAHCDWSDNDLISRNLDTTGWSTLTVSFYFYDDDIDNSDNVYLQFWDGANYVNVYELGNDPEDTWHFYTITLNNIGSEADFFRSGFRIKFEGSSIDYSENLGIDDVLVEVE